jgi:hypothetical protein
MPVPPKLGLPPISPMVAAAVALPIAAAIGKQLPHATGTIVRPSWAPASRPGPNGGGGNNGGMARPIAPVAPQANAPARSPPAISSSTPSHGEASAPTNAGRQTGGVASFKPLNSPSGSQIGSSPTHQGTSPAPRSFQPIANNPTPGQIKPAAQMPSSPIVHIQKSVSPSGAITGPARSENPSRPIGPRVAPLAGVHSNFAHQPGPGRFQHTIQQQRIRTPQVQRQQPQRRR